jgi:hypothetical protein
MLTGKMKTSRVLPPGLKRVTRRQKGGTAPLQKIVAHPQKVPSGRAKRPVKAPGGFDMPVDDPDGVYRPRS